MEQQKFWYTTIFITATLLSCIRLVVLPEGGSVTFLSLLFVWLFTFFFGFKRGLVFSLLFCIAKFGTCFLLHETIFGFEYISPEFLSPIRLNTAIPIYQTIICNFLEYPLAFSCFAFAGLIKEPVDLESDEEKIDENHIVEEPTKLTRGYVLSVFLMYLCYFIAGFLFYKGDKSIPYKLIYDMLYDFSYLFIEGFVTWILLMMPAVQEALFYLKFVVNHDRPRPYIDEIF